MIPTLGQNNSVMISVHCDHPSCHNEALHKTTACKPPSNQAQAYFQPLPHPQTAHSSSEKHITTFPFSSSHSTQAMPWVPTSGTHTVKVPNPDLQESCLFSLLGLFLDWGGVEGQLMRLPPKHLPRGEVKQPLHGKPIRGIIWPLKLGTLKQIHPGEIMASCERR